MKYTLQVNSSPYASHAGLHAYRFAEAAVQAGHEIVRVFFYKDGVYHAFNTNTPPADELNLTTAWSQLATDYAIDLVVCISAAQRRGLLAEDEAKLQGKLDNNLADHFRIAGLGLWLEGGLLADRCLVFG